jgi:TrmH family RNA methyltransferase
MAGILDQCCVVLCRTQGPVNLGMVARLCTNLAVTDLRLVAPQCVVNCSETRKFSTHGKSLILNAPIFPDLASAVQDCGLVVGSSARFRSQQYGTPLALPQAAELIRERKPAKWALVFGCESDGLNDEEMQRCQAYMHLDTFGENSSYNLSHAVGIALYGLATSGATYEAPEDAPADRRMVDHLFRYWMGTLDRFRYFRRTDHERFEPQLRRLFNRLDLSTHDVQMLWGMLAQFQYHAFGDRGQTTDAPVSAAGSAPTDDSANP